MIEKPLCTMSETVPSHRPCGLIRAFKRRQILCEKNGTMSVKHAVTMNDFVYANFQIKLTFQQRITDAYNAFKQ